MKAFFTNSLILEFYMQIIFSFIYALLKKLDNEESICSHGFIKKKIEIRASYFSRRFIKEKYRNKNSIQQILALKVELDINYSNITKVSKSQIYKIILASSNKTQILWLLWIKFLA